jgi:hypothetical protein
MQRHHRIAHRGAVRRPHLDVEIGRIRRSAGDEPGKRCTMPHSTHFKNLAP